MTRTLLVTILLEGAVGLAFCVWRRKPFRPILLTCVIANLLTQSLLWIGLNIFFRYYLIALLIAEILIWMIESVIFFVIRWNRLNFREAFFLSLLMNLSSFGVGWFLPV